MKHYTLTLLLLGLATLSLRAQIGHPDDTHGHDHDGRIFAGGAFTYWYDTKEAKTTLDLCPEVGYLFSDTWGAGVLLGYEYQSAAEDGVTTRSNTLKISPFVRYYYTHRGPFNLFMDAGAGFNFASTTKGGSTQRANGFEIGIRPGGCVDLTEGLCLCLRMGFLGYRHSYFSGEEPGIGENGFGIRFAPEELMIGLELEF